MRFKIPTDISKIAVVLFTSWSESLPKTVELTHENILNDLLWAAGIVWIKVNDVEICYLPPFHSFGFALWIVMPLISWARIVFTPDPNDSKTIADLVGHTKSTFLCSTPTFLNGIVQIAKDDQLKSLRIAIVWAEKCPKDLFTRFAKKSPNATIIEWYWITECSPVIAVNPFKRGAEIKRGTVWLPILWQTVKILDLDTHEEQPVKKEWMIYVSGLNVFWWYVDKKLESPFEEFGGKKWYKTGDLWFLDKDGYLTISWRLKRFVKIAWEMISLPAIETVLARKWKHSDWTECLAIEAEENDWNVKLTLFTTEKLGTSEVNDYLHSEWVTNLVSIDSIIQLKEIPMLGTWKVDHVQLKSLLQWWIAEQPKKTTSKSEPKTKEKSSSSKKTKK
jgi:long-chain-fatty-acid--[acyl-carrier-protein] ligase